MLSSVESHLSSGTDTDDEISGGERKTHCKTYQQQYWSMANINIITFYDVYFIYIKQVQQNKNATSVVNK